MCGLIVLVLFSLLAQALAEYSVGCLAFEDDEPSLLCNDTANRAFISREALTLTLTSDLVPYDGAYSIWAAVYNNPGECSDVSSCILLDISSRPEVQGAFYFVGGQEATLGDDAVIRLDEASLEQVPSDSCSAVVDNTGGRGVTTLEAEVQIYIQYNGPVRGVDEEQRVEQISTIHGGGYCSQEYDDFVDTAMNGLVRENGCTFDEGVRDDDGGEGESQDCTLILTHTFIPITADIEDDEGDEEDRLGERDEFRGPQERGGGGVGRFRDDFRDSRQGERGGAGDGRFRDDFRGSRQGERGGGPGPEEGGRGGDGRFREDFRGGPGGPGGPGGGGPGGGGPGPRP